MSCQCPAQLTIRVKAQIACVIPTCGRKISLLYYRKIPTAVTKRSIRVRLTAGHPRIKRHLLLVNVHVVFLAAFVMAIGVSSPTWNSYLTHIPASVLQDTAHLRLIHHPGVALSVRTMPSFSLPTCRGRKLGNPQQKSSNGRLAQLVGAWY